MSPLPGFQSRTVQPVASRCTNYATPPTNISEGELKSTMDISNFNLRRSLFKKRGKIIMIQSVIYTHPFYPRSPQCLYLPLFNSVVKEKYSLVQNIVCGGRVHLPRLQHHQVTPITKNHTFPAHCHKCNICIK